MGFNIRRGTTSLFDLGIRKMAKKQAGGPNMSEEIRKILTAKPDASNKDVFAALISKFGKGKFNEASCGVAVSNQRKKLGISKGNKRKAVKKPKPGAVRRGRPPASASGEVDMDALKAAKSLLAAVGGDDAAAVAAIRQLHSLQIG